MPNPYQTLGNAPITDDTDYLTEEIQFDIDSNMRTIAIPSEGVVIGVQGDKNVNRVNFRMPAWYNGFDMSTFQPRINFVDPEGNVNYYTVTDMKIYDPDGNEVTDTPTTEDIIYFTWLVDSYATNYVGTVVFNVRFTKFNPTTHALAQAFNTTKAACQVLEGITLADEITQEQQEDLLFHMTAELQDVTDSLKQDIEAKGVETLESIPDDYDELNGKVVGLTNDIHNIYAGNETRNILNLELYADNAYIQHNGNVDGSPEHRCRVIRDLNNVLRATLGGGVTAGALYGLIKNKNTSEVMALFSKSGTSSIFLTDDMRKYGELYINEFGYTGNASTYVRSIRLDFVPIHMIDTLYNASSIGVIADSYYQSNGQLVSIVGPGHKCIAVDVTNFNTLIFDSGAWSNEVYGVLEDESGSVYQLTKNYGHHILDISDYKILKFNFFGDNDNYPQQFILSYDKYLFETETQKLVNMYNTTLVTNKFMSSNGTVISAQYHAYTEIDVSEYNSIFYDVNGDTSLAAFGCCTDENDNVISILPSTHTANQIDISKAKTLYFNFFGDGRYPSSFVLFKTYNYNEPEIVYRSMCRKPFVFNEKIAVFTGDSITYGNTTGNTNVHGTGDYPKLFSDIVGLSHTNSAVPGALFCSGYNSVTTIVNQIKNNTNKSCDYLFIAGGINDWQCGVTLSELASTLNSLCDYINENYSTDTKVIWITPINEAGWNAQSTPKATVQEFRNTITKTVIAKDSNSRFSIIQGNEFNFPNSDEDAAYINALFGDKLHPSALGYKTCYLAGLCDKLL